MNLNSEQMWNLTELSKGRLPSLDFSDGAAVGPTVVGCQKVSAVALHVAAVMMGQALPLHHPPSTALVGGVAQTATGPSAVCLVNPCGMRAWKTVIGLLFCATQHLSVQKLDTVTAES